MQGVGWEGQGGYQGPARREPASEPELTKKSLGFCHRPNREGYIACVIMKDVASFGDWFFSLSLKESSRELLK